MATFTKHKLSGSSNGRAIPVAATATPGTLIHTASSGATALDEVWLYAVNNSAEYRTLNIEWGGVADPDDLFMLALLPREGLVLVVPGLILAGGVAVRAFANDDDVTLVGFVNRITA